MIFLYIVLCIFMDFRAVSGFATPESDFLLDIDGSSISTSVLHTCVIEQRQGDQPGGKAVCWGSGHENDHLDPPEDVIDFL